MTTKKQQISKASAPSGTGATKGSDAGCDGVAARAVALCRDERHGTPCPLPCSACAAECVPAVLVVDATAKPGGMFLNTAFVAPSLLPGETLADHGLISVSVERAAQEVTP